MTYPYLEVAEKKAQGLYEEALKLAETAAQSAYTDATLLEEEIADVVRRHRKAVGTGLTLIALTFGLFVWGVTVQTTHLRSKLTEQTLKVEQTTASLEASEQRRAAAEKQRDAAIAEAKRVPVCPPVVKAPVSKPAPKARTRRGVKPVTHQEVPQTTWKLFPWM